jgi:glycosidase
MYHTTRALLSLLLLTCWGCPQFAEEPERPDQGITTNPDANMGASDIAEAPDSDSSDVSEAPDQPEDLSETRDEAPDQDPNPHGLLPMPPRSCETTLRFEGASQAGQLHVAGEFNGWSSTALPMTRQADHWSAQLTLEPGQYAYKFVIDGNFEGNPPPDDYTKWSGAFENRALIVPDCQRPRWHVARQEVDAQGAIEVVLQLEPGASGAPLDPSTLEVSVARSTIRPLVDPVSGAVTIRHQAPAPGKYTIRAQVRDTAGNLSEQAPLWLPMWYEQGEPFSWQDSVMYLIFTDRFLDTDGGSPLPPIADVPPIAGYMGGDFRGITQKINEGYFDELGVNLLWLSPIYKNPDTRWPGAGTHFTGYHGYWPIHPLDPESRYGDADADAQTRLKELIDAAHARGIRVLFDIVHNHVHQDHVYCQENPSWCARTCTCGSPGCGWDELPLICQFAHYLPDLNYRNHPILVRQIEDTIKLAERYDVDGLRVDAAKHMDHIIMRTLRLRLNELERQGASPFYVVGETYTFRDGHGLIMNYVSDHELHGQFDFPLMYFIRDAFGQDASFRALEAAVSLSQQSYGDFYMWMSPFLGNHDIPRFVTEALGNDFDRWDSSLDVMAQGPARSINEAQRNIINRMAMGHAFLLTQPGVPLLYYGDEIGLAGSGDPDNRRMMRWEWNAAQRELFERVAALGQVRKALKPLRRGATRAQLWVDDDLYVYVRASGPGEAVIVAMNKGAGARSESVLIPASLGLDGVTLKDALSEREVAIVGGRAQISLGSWEYVILAPR